MFRSAVVLSTTFFVTIFAAGCQPSLGDAPFLCHEGNPKCPDGYTCNKANICLKDGVCPAGLPGCGTTTNCGDNKCEAPTETCSNCEADCGKCGTAKCGDGKCEGSETTTSCPADCTTGSCGDGKCEGSETSTSCPADCKTSVCTDGETKCQDKDTLRHCDKGAWKTDPCKNLCVPQYHYAVGCRFSATNKKDICLCGNYAKFGEICDDDVKCDTSLFCGNFGSAASKGFCSKYCSNSGGLCTGAPFGTEARCNLNVSGQTACGFTCDLLGLCPTGLRCDFTTSLCKPS